MTYAERNAAFMRMTKIHGYPLSGRIPEVVRDQPRFGGLSLDKYLQGVYNSFAGMNWAFTKFFLEDLTRLGRWMDNVFPMMLWKDAKKKYAAYFGSEQGDMVEVFSEWKLDTFVYGAKSRRSAGTIYSMGRRNGETRSFIYKGGGFRLPMKFALQNTTAALAMKQLERMDYNIYKTLAFEMVSTLVDESIRSTMESERKNLPFHDTNNVLKRLNFYRMYQFMMHKPGGFERFENAANQILANQEILPNFLLTHMSTMQWVHLDDAWRREYASAGPQSLNDEYRVQQLDPDGRGRTPLHKWRVVCSIPFLLGEDKRIIDPTLLLHRFGLWYQMRHRPEYFTAKNYKNDLRDIRIIDIAKKREETLSFAKAMRHTGLWSKRGELDQVGRLGLLIMSGVALPPTDKNVAALLEEALTGSATKAMRTKLNTKHNNNWSSIFRPDIQSMIKDQRDLAACLLTDPKVHTSKWHSAWNPESIHPFDSLPFIVNAYTWYAGCPGFLDAFLCKVRSLQPDDLVCWEKLIEDYVTKAGAGSHRGYRGGSGGSAPIPRRGAGSSSSGGSGDASESLVVQRIALCLGVATLETRGVTAAELDILDSVGEVALTQLTCSGDVQLNVKQIRYLYLIILRLLRGDNTPALQAIFQTFRNAEKDPRAIAEAIVSAVSRVSRKEDGLFDVDLARSLGVLDCDTDANCNSALTNVCGKSDQDLKIMLQKTRISLAFVEFLLSKNIQIPCSPLLLQPDITITTCANIVANVGPRTGCLCIKDPAVTWVPEVNHSTIEVQCELKARLLIVARQNLLILPHASIHGYHGGGGTTFVDYETYTRIENRRRVPPHDYGIFAVPERPDYTPPHTVISSAGTWHPELYGPNDQSWHYPLAPFFNRRYQRPRNCHFLDVRNYPTDPQGDKEAMQAAPENDLCFAGGFDYYVETANGNIEPRGEAGDSQFNQRLTVASAKMLHGEFDGLDTMPGHSINTAILSGNGGPR